MGSRRSNVKRNKVNDTKWRLSKKTYFTKSSNWRRSSVDKKIPAGIYIDALFKDKVGTFVGVKFYTKTVATDSYGKIKNILEKFSDKFGKRNRLILIAPRFAGTLASISSKEKNLKLLQSAFTLKEIPPPDII